ncbi:hypothetical protein KY331_05850 [Candidatus Woesearchaeota archaeon]|nr:hypothetical protein [Candidatus Woesearchaeota archaeon]
MKITNKQKFILYTLGKWYAEANNKLKGKPFHVMISKSVFIDVAKKAKMVKKKERALYKNLEFLEKKKLISYVNKNLSLTAKGKKLFDKLNEELSPYLNVTETLKKQNPLSYSRKAQTVFRK